MTTTTDTPAVAKTELSTLATPVGFDTETLRIAAQLLAPPIVCGTWAFPDAGKKKVILAAKADPGNALYEMVKGTLEDDGWIMVIQNAAYDLAVIAANYPDLIPLVFEKIEKGLVRCTKVREKLLCLTTSGNLDFMEMPDGTVIKTKYGLADMLRRYRGRDIFKSKEGEDAWRLNYHMLEAVESKDWPQEASDYAISDAVDALDIHDDQETERQRIIRERAIDPFAVQEFRVGLDFALYLMSCQGVCTDAAMVDKVKHQFEDDITPAKLSLLVDTGILRPGEPARPHKRGAKDKVTGLVKMTSAVEPSINMTALKSFVEKLAQQFPDEVTIKKTEASEKFPEGQISVDADWLEEHAHISPVLEQYKFRGEMQKMVTTEIPRMFEKDDKGNPVRIAPVVHPCFDVLKRTGRTSSFATDTYPSFNGQNVDPRARPCYVPRPGRLFFSVDYSFMELVTWAQLCIWLFGQSRLAEIINAGIDPHAWLGAQLQHKLDPDFQQLLKDSYLNYDNLDHMDVYKAFAATKSCGVPEWETSFKKWRKFAKPTGLGYPGGLGPDTFCAFARGTYGVDVNREQAVELRDAWKAAIPEAAPYFDWINNDCLDAWNAPREKVLKDGTIKKFHKYQYTSPMGMVRMGADYCAAANGAGLQTPSAEGAGLAVFNVMRACFDPAMNNVLYGKVFPLIFIHDEIFGEVVDTPQAVEYLSEVGRLMVESFAVVCPDVKIKAQPVLMRRWYKEAEPVFDSSGRLIPWEPKKEGTKP